MTETCNSQPQHNEHPAHPDNQAQSCNPQPQPSADCGQAGNCAPVETAVNVAPHDGGWNAGGDVHQAALISADILAHVNSHETLDVTASVLNCEVVDAHVCIDLSSDHA
jgi:hypothetical protein